VGWCRTGDDFKHDASSQLHACRAHDDAEGLGHAPLAADYYPEITGVDAQLKYADLFPFDHTDLNLVGFIYEHLCDRLNQFLHLNYLRWDQAPARHPDTILPIPDI
jgi:hypothetical protein